MSFAFVCCVCFQYHAAKDHAEHYPANLPVRKVAAHFPEPFAKTRQ